MTDEQMKKALEAVCADMDSAARRLSELIPHRGSKISMSTRAAIGEALVHAMLMQVGLQGFLNIADMLEVLGIDNTREE